MQLLASLLVVVRERSMRPCIHVTNRNVEGCMDVGCVPIAVASNQTYRKKVNASQSNHGPFESEYEDSVKLWLNIIDDTFV